MSILKSIFLSDNETEALSLNLRNEDLKMLKKKVTTLFNYLNKADMPTSSSTSKKTIKKSSNL